MLDATTVSVIGLLSGGLGFLVRMVFNAGQKESGISAKVEGHANKLGEHGKRLDGHDERLRGLNNEFVPRTEVERALSAVEKDQRESKQLLLHLVTRKPIDADVDLN